MTGQAKKCTKCNSLVSLDGFSFRIKSRGILRAQCKACDANAKRAYLSAPNGASKAKAYKEANKHKALEQDRLRRRESQKYKESRRKQRQSEASKNKRKEYLSRPEVKQRTLELRRKRQRERYRSCVATQINAKFSCLVRRSLKTGKNNKSWRDLVDFSVDELRAHLERQFTAGMSWESFLRGEIHIDHIRPLSGFEFKSATDREFRACWSLGNLRPLWADENRKKRNRQEFLL